MSRNICIISHSSLIEMMKDERIDLEDNAISKVKYCFPYTMSL